MNRNHMNTPLFPGAMTPAQLLRQAAQKAACIIATAAAVAMFAAIFVLFN